MRLTEQSEKTENVVSKKIRNQYAIIDDRKIFLSFDRLALEIKVYARQTNIINII